MIIEGITSFVTAVTFYQFIMEEACQTGFMGVYLAYKNGKPHKAQALLEHLKTITIPHLYEVNRTYGMLNYWNRHAFYCFTLAAWMAWQAYQVNLPAD